MPVKWPRLPAEGSMYLFSRINHDTSRGEHISLAYDDTSDLLILFAWLVEPLPVPALLLIFVLLLVSGLNAVCRALSKTDRELKHSPTLFDRTTISWCGVRTARLMKCQLSSPDPEIAHGRSFGTCICTTLTLSSTMPALPWMTRESRK
jgi:hypothetical protein